MMQNGIRYLSTEIEDGKDFLALDEEPQAVRNCQGRESQQNTLHAYLAPNDQPSNNIHTSKEKNSVLASLFCYITRYNCVRQFTDFLVGGCKS